MLEQENNMKLEDWFKQEPQAEWLGEDLETFSKELGAFREGLAEDFPGKSAKEVQSIIYGVLGSFFIQKFTPVYVRHGWLFKAAIFFEELEQLNKNDKSKGI